MGNPRLSLSEEEIVKMYVQDKMSTQDIAAYYGTSTTPIRARLRKLGLLRHVGCGSDKNLKYSLNEDYFASIDTLAKCWVLGWFYADGYNNPETGDMRITLHDKDEEVLAAIAREMGSNRPIFMVPKRHTASLILSRKKMAEDLAELGCVRCKSLIIKWPEVIDTREKTCAFLRGVIEGDGCIHISRVEKRRGPCVKLTIACGSPDFVQSLKEIFKAYWDIDGFLMMRDGKVIGIRWDARRAKIKAMLDEIYNIETLGLYLKRKYQKYLEATKLLDYLIKHHRQRSDSMYPELASP